MKKIAIVVGMNKDKNQNNLKKVVKAFSRDYKILLNTAYKASFENYNNVDFFEEEEQYCFSDAVLVLGGDGSILGAARLACIYDKPILGINLGHVGYLARAEMSDLEEIKAVLSSEFATEERSMLDIHITDKNGSVSSYHALNDAVITKSEGFGIIDITMYCNMQKTCRYRCDGVIIATPTGSTGYSMSAGGSVVDPLLDCILLTPVCAHSLRSRPIVFSSSSEIRIALESDMYKTALVADGVKIADLDTTDKVVIKASEYKTRLIKFRPDGFYNVLYNKMND